MPSFDFAGVSNAIDLADRFLPKLQSLNCELFTWFHQIMSLPYCLSDQIFQNPVNEAN